MPFYDFELLDKNGAVMDVVAVNVPIAKRDEVTFRRVTVPRRVTVMGSATDNPHDDHRIDMKNLSASEDRLGSNFDRFYGRPKEEVRKLWSKKEKAA